MKRALKITGLLALTLFAMAALFYLTLLVISRNDQPPSTAAEFFLQQLNQRPPVADAENAYLHLLGLGAGVEESPYEFGAAWTQWAEQPFSARDSLPEPDLWSPLFPDPLQQLLETCRTPSACCIKELEASVELLPDLIAAERLLLERYRALSELSDWREHRLSDLAAPFPSYQNWLDLSRVGMFEAWLAARQGRLAEAQSALDSDGHLWRFALAEADYLITKMITRAGLEQNMRWSNILARDFKVPLPLGWQVPISPQERSMTGVFTGEYGFASVASSDLGLGDGVDSSIPLILRGLFRAQASNNMLAEHLVAAAEVMEGPLDALPARLTAYRGTLVPPHKWSLYNPVGHFLMNSYFMDFTRYGTRVTDLEGMRRALLIAAELRKAGVPPTKVEQHLAEHELTNPYTGEPLLWDEEEGAMVFDGLGDDSFYLPY